MLNSIESLKQRLSDENIWDKELIFNRWEFIKSPDSIDTNLYFVEEGCARIYFEEEEYEHSLYFGHDGSLISALDSFLTEAKSTLAIQCLNKTRVKTISKSTFQDFIERDPQTGKLWQSALSELSVWHMEREKDLMIKSPKLRYERVLSRQPHLFQKVPHKYIASYLGISPETLSRIQNS